MSISFHDLGTDDAPRARRQQADDTGLFVAIGLVGLLVAGGIGAAVYYSAEKKPAAVARVEPEPERPKQAKVKAGPAQEPVVEAPAVPEPAAAPRAETAKDLLGKGRDQYSEGDFVLAEQTWLKGAELCTDSEDDQLLKAELFLRVGLSKKRSTTDLGIFGAYGDTLAAPYYKRFYEILNAQRKTSMASAIESKTSRDQYELWLIYFKNKAR